MEEKRKINNSVIKSMLAEAGAFCIAIAFFFVIYRAQGIGSAISRVAAILRPIVIGSAIAYLMTPFCGKFEKWFSALFRSRAKGLVKLLSVTLTMVLGLLAVYCLIIMIIPNMYTSIVYLSDTLPDEAQGLIDKVGSMLQNNPELLDYAEGFYERFTGFLNDWVSNTLLPYFKTIIGGVGSGVISVVISIKDILLGLVVTFYILWTRRAIGSKAKMLLYSIFKPKWAGQIEKELSYADKMFSGYLTGKLIDSALVGVVCYVFCIVAKMPEPLLVSAVIAVTNVIPFFGPFIGGIPMGLLILIESPSKCIVFVIFCIVMQQIEGNILEPKILGSSVGLSSLSVLFAILLFGGLFGFIGMILGVPLYAVIYDILAKLVKKGLARHGYEIVVPGEEDKERKETDPDELSGLSEGEELPDEPAMSGAGEDIPGSLDGDEGPEPVCEAGEEEEPAAEGPAAEEGDPA